MTCDSQHFLWQIHQFSTHASGNAESKWFGPRCHANVTCSLMLFYPPPLTHRISWMYLQHPLLYRDNISNSECSTRDGSAQGRLRFGGGVGAYVDAVSVHVSMIYYRYIYCFNWLVLWYIDNLHNVHACKIIIIIITMMVMMMMIMF